MDLALISNWNQTVGADDHVYHLGDFALQNHLQYKSQLHGHIHWILGNHDKDSDTVKHQFASVNQLLMPKIGKQKLFLFHYPCVSWWHKGYGTWHLYGHVHGGYSRAGEASLDVGCDCHNYRPISYEEVATLIDAKINAKSKNPNPEKPTASSPEH
jgi:calcineurin-like phosphoesterase family protein